MFTIYFLLFEQKNTIVESTFHKQNPSGIFVRILSSMTSSARHLNPQRCFHCLLAAFRFIATRTRHTGRVWKLWLIWSNYGSWLVLCRGTSSSNIVLLFCLLINIVIKRALSASVSYSIGLSVGFFLLLSILLNCFFAFISLLIRKWLTILKQVIFVVQKFNK